MLSQKLQDAINAQINAELHSAYIYLSMSAFLEAENLAGMAHWMRRQAEEETEHAMKFLTFMVDRGGRVLLQSIAAPETEFGSALGVFEGALAHEQKISASIHRLYKLAQEENDYPTMVMLQWFITEQVEEEKNAGDAVARLQMVGAAPAGLLMIDREMAHRAGD